MNQLTPISRAIVQPHDQNPKMAENNDKIILYQDQFCRFCQVFGHVMKTCVILKPYYSGQFSSPFALPFEYYESRNPTIEDLGFLAHY